MNESVMKRIESIEKELGILKQEVQDNEKNEVLKTKRFIPNNGEEYFYVNKIGGVSSTPYDSENLMDRFNVKIRNCFRTKEEAEDHKRFIYILNQDFVTLQINWKKMMIHIFICISIMEE